MQILSFCRHKKAGWEGVIFRADNGRIRITNGFAIWDDSEKRRAALEEMEKVDLKGICEGLERYSLDHELLALLRTCPGATDERDQEYLSEPTLEGLVFQISEERIDIRCRGSILAQAKGPSPILDRKALLEQYRRVYKEGRERKLQISFANHMQRKIQNRWADYLAAAEDRAQTYQKMLDHARALEKRKIHRGYRSDRVLQAWYSLQSHYDSFSHSGNPCQVLEWIAKELKGLERAFAAHPEMRGRGNKIYL